MYTHFNTINRQASGKRSFSIVAVLVSMVAAVLAALVAGPATTASAATVVNAWDSPGSISFGDPASAGSGAMLIGIERSTATGYVGGFKLGQLNIGLDSSNVYGQKVNVAFYLQKKTRATAANPNPQWTTVERQDTTRYLWGKPISISDMALATTTTGKERNLYRVFVDVEWEDANTHAFLGEIQVVPSANVPSALRDVSCQTTHVECGTSVRDGALIMA